MAHSDATYARDGDARDGMFQSEHFLAWGMALAAIVLGVLGLLRGFGIIGDDETVTSGIGDAANGSVGAISETGSLWDGAVWLLPAISAALLSFALHRNDHHRSSRAATSDADEGMGSTEHAMAWVMALGTIALGTLAILVGFDVFDRGNTQSDGILWALASIGTGVLTNTLHSVRHHQYATDEDYILSVVERRAAGAGTRGTIGERGTIER